MINYEYKTEMVPIHIISYATIAIILKYQKEKWEFVQIVFIETMQSITKSYYLFIFKKEIK